MLTTIAFDADDTLWQCEAAFKQVEQHFQAALAPYVEGVDLTERLLEVERRNLAFYGFGVKGFTLSLIETAIDVTAGRAPGAVIAGILESGRALLHEPVELLPDVRAVLEGLAPRYRLMLITKGDLFDQERKLAASGLGDLFQAVEIVSTKTVDTYTRLLGQRGAGAGSAMMVGNSLKSDILPALAAGCWAVYTPHPLTWALEHAEEPLEARRYRRVDSFAALPALIGTL